MKPAFTTWEPAAPIGVLQNQCLGVEVLLGDGDRHDGGYGRWRDRAGEDQFGEFEYGTRRMPGRQAGYRSQG